MKAWLSKLMAHVALETFALAVVAVNFGVPLYFGYQYGRSIEAGKVPLAVQAAQAECLRAQAEYYRWLKDRPAVPGPDVYTPADEQLEPTPAKPEEAKR